MRFNMVLEPRGLEFKAWPMKYLIKISVGLPDLSYICSDGVSFAVHADAERSPDFYLSDFESVR